MSAEGGKRKMAQEKMKRRVQPKMGGWTEWRRGGPEDVCLEIRPALEKQARRTFTKFTPIWSKSQVVAGMNYKIVIDVDSAPDYVSASVYKNTRGQCRFGWDWTRDVPPGSLMVETTAPTLMARFK